MECSAAAGDGRGGMNASVATSIGTFCKGCEQHQFTAKQEEIRETEIVCAMSSVESYVAFESGRSMDGKLKLLQTQPSYTA